MKTYRIGKTQYIHDLSGKGAFLYGGRWNFKGHPVLYTTSSRALAVLENLVHIGDEPGKGEYSLLELSIPGAIKILGLKHLKLTRSRMNQLYEGKEATKETIQSLGTQWLKSLDSAVLKIPSAVISEEDNFLLNPLHPDFNSISITSVRVFNFDERLFFPKAI